MIKRGTFKGKVFQEGVVAFLFIFILSGIYNCKPKDPFPEQLDGRLILEDVTDATVNALSEITTTPPGEVIEYGHAWKEGEGLPTLTDQHTRLFKSSVPTPFAFTSRLTGLKRNTIYSVRAYVRTGNGTAWGGTETFHTKDDYIDRLVAILDDSLKGRDFGYSFMIFRKGQQVGERHGGFQARSIEVDGEVKVSPDSKMQIASMTKTLTAAAFLKLAGEKGIAATDRIVDYLPTGWEKGDGIEKITFKDLLQHRSGITGFGDNCQNGAFLENIWIGLRQIIGKGVGDQRYGNYCYQNVNFGLFRVLIPSILGYTFTGDDDTDNAETMRIYEEYVRQALIENAGVYSDHLLDNSPLSPTYGYDYPYSEGSYGFNPGNFKWHAGGYGFYLSANEAAKVFASIAGENDFRILNKAQKDSLVLSGFGSFSAITPQGKFNYHDGWWQYGLNSGRPKGFRSLWMSGPDDIVVVMFTNGLRNGDGLFPIRAFQYQDITSYVLWAFSRLYEDGANSRTQMVDFHQYLEDPNPH